MPTLQILFCICHSAELHPTPSDLLYVIRLCFMPISHDNSSNTYWRPSSVRYYFGFPIGWYWIFKLDCRSVSSGCGRMDETEMQNSKSCWEQCNLRLVGVSFSYKYLWLQTIALFVKLKISELVCECHSIGVVARGQPEVVPSFLPPSVASRDQAQVVRLGGKHLSLLSISLLVSSLETFLPMSSGEIVDSFCFIFLVLNLALCI